MSQMTPPFAASADELATGSPDVRARSAFDAFISYSHRLDSALGRSLKYGIERFAKPWYRARVRRVFLDNSNLALEPDLTAAIKSALAGSDFFLLLASPAAAASRWVDAEVLWWLEHKRADRLLVLLTDGVFEWDLARNALASSTNSLPPALVSAMTSEPRWVDLRDVRQVDLDLKSPTWQAVLADVVATIDGVDKDALIGRHVREGRRTRRTVIVAVMSLAVLLVAATGFGIRSQQQSNLVRQQSLTAVSRQLAAQSTALRDSQPGLARQLLAQAYRMAPTPEVVGALLESSSIPRVIPTAGLSRDVAFSPSRDILAVASDRGIAVVSASSSATLATVESTDGYAGAISFSPDGQLLAVGFAKGVTKVFDVSAPERPVQFATVNSPSGGIVTGISFIPGSTVVAVTITNSQTRLYDLSEPAAPREVVAEPGDTRLYWGTNAVSSDGQVLAVSGFDGTIVLWDVSDPAAPVRRSTLSGHTGPVVSLRFAAAGRLLASGSDDNTVRLWNVADPDRPVQYSVLSGASLGIEAVAFSPDGGTLATGDGNRTIGLWRVDDPQRPSLIASLRGHTDSIRALAFSPDSRVLASASADGPERPGASLSTENSTVRLWNVLSASRSAASVTLPAGRGAPVFLPGKPMLVTGFPAVLYDLSVNMRPQQVATLKTYHQGGGQAMAFSSDGRRLVIGMPVVALDMTDPAHPREPAGGVQLSGGAESLVLSPNDALAAAGEPQQEYSLWLLAGDHPVQAATLQGSQTAAQGLAFDSTSKAAVTSSGNGDVQLWDVRDPRQPKLVHTEPMNSDGVTSVAFRPGSDLVATGSASGAVTIWDTGNGTTLRKISTTTVHTGSVDGIAFHPTNSLLTTAGADGDLRIWEVSDPKRPVEIATLDAGGRFLSARVAFSPDGTMLAATDGQELRVWTFDLPRILGRLCAESSPVSETDWNFYLPDYPYDPPCAS